MTSQSISVPSATKSSNTAQPSRNTSRCTACTGCVLSAGRSSTNKQTWRWVPCHCAGCVNFQRRKIGSPEEMIKLLLQCIWAPCSWFPQEITWRLTASARECRRLCGTKCFSYFAEQRETGKQPFLSENSASLFASVWKYRCAWRHGLLIKTLRLCRSTWGRTQGRGRTGATRVERRLDCVPPCAFTDAYTKTTNRSTARSVPAHPKKFSLCARKLECISNRHWTRPFPANHPIPHCCLQQTSNVTSDMKCKRRLVLRVKLVLVLCKNEARWRKRGEVQNVKKQESRMWTFKCSPVLQFCKYVLDNLYCRRVAADSLRKRRCCGTKSYTTLHYLVTTHQRNPDRPAVSDARFRWFD